MEILKNKLVLFAPILVAVIVLIFGSIMIPSINPTPENLPIAIVNEDEGVDIPTQGTLNFGVDIVEEIIETSEGDSDQDGRINWVQVDSYDQVSEGLDNNEYYAALIFPKEFSENQASLQSPEPVSPEINIVVNEGAYPTAVSTSTKILNDVVDNLNETIKIQLLEGFEKQGATLNPKQAEAVAAPIVKEITYVNELGDDSANGNAPVLMFQPFWVSTIVGSALFTLGMGKINFMKRTTRLTSLLIQLCYGAVLSAIVGFGLPRYVEALGIEVPKYLDMALFIMVAYMCMFLMQSAVMSWVGIKGDIIFIVILFFGGPLLSLPPEFMSPFYRDWIYPWLPVRFVVEGLREIFYFGNGFSINNSLNVLIWIGAVSLVVFLSSVLKVSVKKNQQQFELKNIA